MRGRQSQRPSGNARGLRAQQASTMPLAEQGKHLQVKRGADRTTVVRSSIPACPDAPPAISMSKRMGTIYPGAPGATDRQSCARSPAEHATSNTTEEANDRCRTPDDSTAEDEHSDHNRTTPATRQAPAWAPFTFQGLSCELRHAAHGRFVKARPARPTSTRLRSCRAHQSTSGGSIVAQTKTHTGPRRRIARNDWRSHGARDEMRGTRGQPGPRRVDNGNRDAEYMGASRSKAYDLIWSGEIDSYRLGRKLLVSRASVDAYIDLRSGGK